MPPKREAIMKKPVKPAEQIAAFNPHLILHPCLATDPAVGWPWQWEFFTQLDKVTQNKLMAAKLEAEAAVHRTLADANTQVAGILKSRG
jgi:hypothetical protein